MENMANTYAVLETTEGTIVFEMYPDIAPKAVENFLTHCTQGYYDGTIFHRIMKGFMIQGGDPQGTGMGGESIWGSGFGIECGGDYKHKPYTLAMAQSSMPNSIGSQFFINTNDNSFLNAQYTVFGAVVEGKDVVDKLENTPVKSSMSGESSQPTVRVEIIKAYTKPKQ